MRKLGEEIVTLAAGDRSMQRYGRMAGNLVAPELPASAPPTVALALLRELFANWGLDEANRGSEQWNPLGELIPSGSRVVVKPNWVHHATKTVGPLEALITHRSLIEAVLEYIALARPSSVVVGDAPLQSCDFAALCEQAGLAELENWSRARGIALTICDFRRTISPAAHPGARKREEVRGMESYTLFDLESESSLCALDGEANRYRVTCYDPDVLGRTHSAGHHCYLIAREMLEADVVVNLPKLKCHKKSCITGALKNLVGINGHKEYLPHHRRGGSEGGGDCYAGAARWKQLFESALDTVNQRGSFPALRYGLGRMLAGALKGAAWAGADDNVEGSWYGNDTIWRTCIDLNRILRYGDTEGKLHDCAQRSMIHITDAIVAGEGEGPLHPAPVTAGFLSGALNAAAADYVHARLMGFDPERIPIVRGAFERRRYPVAGFSPEEIRVRSRGHQSSAAELWPLRQFVPPKGWSGHCELQGIHDDLQSDLARL